ncbi:MAG: PSD1 and planctomycete cytochrome C domain-containing protein [Gemmataceae bacterium]
MFPRLGLASLVLLVPAVVRAAPPKAVDFNRDVRPILATNCFKCHGPDDAVRKAGLRFDRRDAAVKELKSGDRAIVPGDPAKSELIARVTMTDDGMMPPASVGKRLTAAEVATLCRWIEQGAKYSLHWSYAKPLRHPLPAVSDPAWPRTPVDRFILARLDKEGLKPAAAADRYTLVRRVSIDLTGLPPTPEEAERFVRDTSPDAYGKLVDRLLSSPVYGERWAQVWLDLARYADSQGYANDPDRTIWRWRDWLIAALNDNRSFDRFTVEMLAGDLLPNPTPDQLVATGFHRNTLTNTEGGTNPEEFRSAAVVDRVNTTMQVWMGTTIGCCQCHNHKYDPITQKEYYQLYAILNNTEDANSGNDSPTLPVPRLGYESEFRTLEAQRVAVKQKYDELTRKIDAEVGPPAAEVLALLPRPFVPLVQKSLKPDPKVREKTLAHFRNQSPEWKALDARLRDLTAKVTQISTTTPILRESKPRPTHVHIRGNFLDKGEAVSPGLPSAFPAPPAGSAMNRLTLARWLVSPENPLTARVAVNRLWEELFGVGLVETSEEFGMQGEPPSHPELLDWLATEYVRLGWDTKQMLKLLVTSAAYRQSSQTSDASKQRDPYNRLLSRGPRVRLAAEEVRDQALFAAGLLSPKMYGPPVQPPKPNFGLSAAFGGTTDWQPSPGEDKYRRGLYIRVRRNAPYPSMTTFDAPERTYCTVRRICTNTPLQALVTLNDPVYVEAAQALARRIVQRPGNPAERAAYGFRLVLTRPPSGAEVKRLSALFEQARDQYRKDPAKAAAMATKPLGPPTARTELPELAAWTVVGNVLLNLDETLAKP